MEEISNRKNIELLVDTFYKKVQQDPLLAPVFNNVIKDHWPQHLEKMYDFWQTLLFGEQAYKGSPFLKHVTLPVKREHFSQWLKLFNETLDENFSGDIAMEARKRAMNIADMFQAKMGLYQESM